MRSLQIFLLLPALAGCGGNVQCAEESEEGTCRLPPAQGAAPGTMATTPTSCRLEATDEGGNRFAAVCDEQGCDCYFNDELRCDCPHRQGLGMHCNAKVTVCCLDFPFADVDLGQ